MLEPVLPTELAAAATRFGRRTALRTADGWTVTYRQLHTIAEEIAAGLSERRLCPGDVLATMLPAGPEQLLLLLGAARAGIAVAGVNPRAPLSVRRAALGTIRPDVVVGTADLLEGVDDLGGGDAWVVGRATGTDDLVHELRGAGPAPVLPADPDRPVAIVLTSGTTGPAKGAVFTDRQIDAIRRADVGDRRGGGTAMLLSTELVHVGITTKLAWYLRTGATMVLLRRWRAEDVLRAVVDHRMVSLGGVSAQVALLLRVPWLDDADLSHLRTLVVGGGPSPPSLVTEARERLGVDYSIRYSSTESGGVGTATAFDADDEEALHTVGRPRAGVEVDIRHEDGRRREPGVVGEVWLRSPAVMSGYWRDQRATADTLVGGWLRTGDLGALDERGCLRLAGRAGEVYIRGGYNVHPVAVERILSAHPAVAELAVVPRPDPVMGEVGVAVVVPHPGRDAPSLEALRAFARRDLAHHELPEELVAVEALPRTSMGKLDRRSLRDRVGAPASPRSRPVR